MGGMLPAANAILADPTGPDYANAATVVTQATSCQDAVDRLGLLEGQSPQAVREAEAVFAAMPTAVDQGILHALRVGFGSKSPMKLHWVEDKSGGKPTVAHRVDQQDDWVHVHVTAPDGQQFL
jgi:hypothetical protein